MEELRHYILVRKDMPTNVQLVQACHAAADSIVESIVGYRTSCIVLHVEDQEALLCWEKKIYAGLTNGYVVVREPDAPWEGEATAIGVTPSPAVTSYKKFFRELYLAEFGDQVDAS